MEKALLAYDGSDGAQRALRTAVELFRDRGIMVTVVGVAEGIPLYGFAGTLPSPEQEEERRRQLEEAGKTLAEHGIAFAVAQRSGDSASVILHEAGKEGVDLIVMGPRPERARALAARFRQHEGAPARGVQRPRRAPGASRDRSRSPRRLFVVGRTDLDEHLPDARRRRPRNARGAFSIPSITVSRSAPVAPTPGPWPELREPSVLGDEALHA
jgi:nucleotide-binding universal stress UspA family protein